MPNRPRQLSTPLSKITNNFLRAAVWLKSWLRLVILSSLGAFLVAMSLPPYTHPIHQRLDTSGLLCPLPVLKAQKILRTMQSGEVLEVLATDPKAWHDFPIFCEEQNHNLLQHNILQGDKNNGRFVFIIQKQT